MNIYVRRQSGPDEDGEIIDTCALLRPQDLVFSRELSVEYMIPGPRCCKSLPSEQATHQPRQMRRKRKLALAGSGTSESLNGHYISHAYIHSRCAYVNQHLSPFKFVICPTTTLFTFKSRPSLLALILPVIHTLSFPRLCLQDTHSPERNLWVHDEIIPPSYSHLTLVLCFDGSKWSLRPPASVLTRPSSSGRPVRLRRAYSSAVITREMANGIFRTPISCNCSPC
jgi:hypothetical protein